MILQQNVQDNKLLNPEFYLNCNQQWFWALLILGLFSYDQLPTKMHDLNRLTMMEDPHQDIK